ncbi:CCHC-type domain-containing protein [Trichonephila clavipes]|nr:CCHC-type domain-containing protein [Trichonephila clavipes]
MTGSSKAVDDTGVGRLHATQCAHRETVSYGEAQNRSKTVAQCRQPNRMQDASELYWSALFSGLPLDKALRSKRPTRVPLLTKKRHRQLRLRWARDHRDWSMGSVVELRDGHIRLRRPFRGEKRLPPPNVACRFKIGKSNKAENRANSLPSRNGFMSKQAPVKRSNERRRRRTHTRKDLAGVSSLRCLGRGQKCRPSKEAKPAVVSPSLQQWRSPSTFRGRLGKTLSNGLKSEYDRVATFNKWDDMMCLAPTFISFLTVLRDGGMSTTKTPLDSWEAFKNGLSGLFGDRQKYTRRAEEQLKCRAQRSGESTQSIQGVLGLCQEKRSFRDEVERVLAPVSTNLQKLDPDQHYAAVTGKYRAPVQKFPPQPRKTDVWRTADNRPVCFHCGRPGHVMRYCREKRLSLTTLETADGTSTTLALKKKYADQTLRRFTPNPTRPIPNTSLQIPVAISPIQSVARP